MQKDIVFWENINLYVNAYSKSMCFCDFKGGHTGKWSNKLLVIKFGLDYQYFTVVLMSSYLLQI